MYISTKDRDYIVNFLSGVVVPAQTGANIMNTVDFLSNLPEEKPVGEAKKNDEKPAEEKLPKQEAPKK